MEMVELPGHIPGHILCGHTHTVQVHRSEKLFWVNGQVSRGGISEEIQDQKLHQVAVLW